MWLATPVPNDELVPLLESKNITYQGIKSDESHVALILGIVAGLTFVIILGMSYKRMNPVKSMSALTRGRRRGATRRRGRNQLRLGGWRGRSEGRARGDRQVPAQPGEVLVARRARAEGRAARRPSGNGKDAAGPRGCGRSRRAVFLRERLGVHRGVRRRGRLPRAQAVRTSQGQGARDHLHRRARCDRQEPFRRQRRRRNRRAGADAESAARRDGRVRLARRHRRAGRHQPSRDPRQRPAAPRPLRQAGARRSARRDWAATPSFRCTRAK